MSSMRANKDRKLFRFRKTTEPSNECFARRRERNIVPVASSYPAVTEASYDVEGSAVDEWFG